MRGISLRVRAVMFMVLMWATLLVPAAQAHDPAEAAVGDVKAVVVGHGHTCAVSNEGRAYCWGYNVNGQLGEGTTTSRLTPTPVAIPQTEVVTQIAPARDHSCAVTADGSAYCWGDNDYGQLGDGTTTDRLLPTLVNPPVGDAFVQIAPGLWHTCAVTAQGKLLCWGRGGTGVIGDGAAVDRLTPVPVASANGFLQGRAKQVAAGQNHTCAVTVEAGLYCWGGNFYGEVGNGTTAPQYVPVAVSGGLLAASVGTSAVSTWTCAVTTGAEAYCWGDNTHGALGDGTTVSRSTPGAVFGGSGLAPGTVATIDTAQFSSCATTITARAYCWGKNYSGTLGDGTTTDRLIPTAVQVGQGFQHVRQLGVGGNSHTCGSTVTGHAFCWGNNFTGQLGDGTTTGALTPIHINVVTRPYEPTYDDVTACAAGGHGDCPATSPEDAPEPSAAEPTPETQAAPEEPDAAVSPDESSAAEPTDGASGADQG